MGDAMVDKSEAICIEHGVTREDFRWGRIWKGTPAALLAAGIVQREWLADGSERDKRGRMVRTKKIEHAGHTFRVQWMSRSTYEVWEEFSEAERLESERRDEFENELRNQAAQRF